MGDGRTSNTVCSHSLNFIRAPTGRQSPDEPVLGTVLLQWTKVKSWFLGFSFFMVKYT